MTTNDVIARLLRVLSGLPGGRLLAARMRRWRRSYQDKLFAAGQPRLYSFEGKQITLPARHPLPELLDLEPYREGLLRATARHCFSPERNAFVDVGANIGYTAMIVESEANSPVAFTLVEPSAHFLPYLRENVSRLSPVAIRIIPKFASPTRPQAPLRGYLHHWGGTAELVALSDEFIPVDSQVDVASLISEDVALVKIDCDGLDTRIVDALLRGPCDHRPMILFENTIRNSEDSELLASVLDRANDLGYSRVALAHPTGPLLYAGTLGDQMWDILRFQIHSTASAYPQTCYYTDVLLSHECDRQSFESIVRDIRRTQSP